MSEPGRWAHPGRALAALTALVALSLPVAAPAAGASGPATTSHRAAAVTSPTVDIVSQTPTVRADGTFLLSATVRGAPKGAKLRITLDRDPLADRSALYQALFGVERETRAVPIPSIPLDDAPRAGDSGRSVVVAIALRRTAPAQPGQISLERGLVRAGVYPLDLEVIDADGSRLGLTTTTYLVRLAERGVPSIPLRTALVLEVDAVPAVGSNGRSDLSAADVERLAAQSSSLAAVPDVPVTIDATPETIEAMARDSAASRAALADLSGSLRGRQVLDRPYVDLAFTSWIAPDLRAALATERSQGSRVLERQLTRPDPTTWLASRDLNTQAADVLWSQGVRQLLLRGQFFAPVPPVDGEPTLARPFQVSTPSGTLSAVQVDGSLQAAFSRQRQGDPELAAYQVVADLAIIQSEHPDATRGVVIAAPPEQDTPTAFLTTLLRALKDDPMVKPSTVQGLFRDVRPVGTSDDGTGPPLTRALRPSLATNLGSYPAELARVSAKVTSFSAIMGPSDPTVGQWQQRLLISGSSDLTAAQRHSYLAVIEVAIDRQLGSVDAPARQTVTLTARDGIIPFTLRSRLRRAIRVVVEVESSSRLEFPEGNRQEVTLEPGTRQIRIRVRTRSPGDAPIDIRVVSPDGGLALTASRVTVRSTAVSGIGYALTVGAALFLVLWWFRHWSRARRANRVAPPDGAGTVGDSHDHPSGADLPDDDGAPADAT